MPKLLIAPLLCVSLAAPALAESTERLNFSRDGVGFSATVKTVGDTQFISGRETESGKPFRLRVTNGKVTGTYGTNYVAYRLPATPAPTVTASR